MIYLLNGDSSLLNELYIRSNPISKTWISGSEGLEGLRTALAAVTMFGDNAIVISDLDSWKKQQRKDAIDLILREGGQRTIFAVCSRDRIEGSEVVAFNKPKPWNPKGWLAHIRKISDQLGLKISDEAADTLFEMCGNNEHLVFNELQKISNISTTINRDIVERFCAYHQRIRYDEISYLVAAGRIRRALEELGEDYGEDEFPIFCSILTGLLHDMGIVIETLKGKLKNLTWKDMQEISRKTGIGIARLARITGYSFSPGKSAAGLINGFEQSNLIQTLDRLQAIDQDYKFGRISGFTAFLKAAQLFER